jgi:hypothetical protein
MIPNGGRNDSGLSLLKSLSSAISEESLGDPRLDRSDAPPSSLIGVVKAAVLITVHGAPHLLCH